jgi:hypothetical protein
VAKYCRNISKPDGTAVPGIIIPFSSTIQHSLNFFGLDYAAGDHNYTPSNYATKIYSVGIALPGYIGMDSYAAGNAGSGAADTTSANALGATPYVYLIPCGNDSMLAPPLGDTNTARTWTVQDQALPLPYNLGGTDFNSTQFFSANGTLSEQPWIIRKHQAFRPVADATMFYGSVPQEFTNTRLHPAAGRADRPQPLCGECEGYPALLPHLLAFGELIGKPTEIMRIRPFRRIFTQPKPRLLECTVYIDEKA